MTNAQRAKRQARRERNNPDREAAKWLGAKDTVPVAAPRRRLKPDWFRRVARSMR